MTTRSRGRLLAASALTAIALAGCGGSQSAESTTTTSTTKPPPVPAPQWADSVCGDLADWRDSLMRTAGGLAGSAIGGQQSLADVLSSAMQQVKDATGQLIDDIKSLGPPSTPDGDTMRQKLGDLANSLSDTVDELQSQASQLSKDAPASQNLSQLATMAKEIEDAAGNAQQTLSSLEGLDPAGQLKAAFEQSSECAALTGSQTSPPTT